MRFFLTLLLLTPFAISSQDEPLYEQLINNVPAEGEERTVYLGDRMLTQRHGQFKECLVPRKNLSINSRGTGYEFLRGKPVCKTKADDEYYYPNYTLSTNCRGIENVGTCVYFQTQPILFVENESDYELHIATPKLREFGKPKFHKAFQMKGINKKDIVVDQKFFLYTEDTFQQVLEYSGKSGSVLRFTYSEFIEGLARDAYTREFTVDLNEGNVGAYKGAVFEVLEATNANITYKIIRHFPVN